MADHRPPASELVFSNLPDPGERYKLGSKLGSGVGGKVYEAVDNKTGNKVAVKVINFTPEIESEIKEEYRVLNELSEHPNLPTFHGIYLKKGRADMEHVWLIMELCDGGTAVDYVKGILRQNKKIPETHVAYILRETVKAVVHLHDHHVVHRDIRGSNLLLTGCGQIKLIDYGITRPVDRTLDKINTCIGSPCWMAPEVVTSQSGEEYAGYDNRSDVWALGITAIELGDGKAPFQDMHPARALFQIVRNPPPTLYRPANWSQLYNDFVNECLEKNADNRPFIQEIIEHPFFETVQENQLQIIDEIKETLAANKQLTAEQGQKKPDTQVKRGYLKTEQQVAVDKIYQEDLAALENLTEDSILDELHQRMRKKQYHTFVGEVLLVLNGNEKQDIYGDKYHGKYEFKARSDNSPHIYTVADSAYQDVLHNEEPQHILMAGETLSGKTTNMLHVLDHLLYLGKGNNCGVKVEKAFHIIHTLGNAGTPHNPNSTRNLLQAQITFTQTGKISGAIFWMYMLEKNRVTTADLKQANFHVFYYFYDAMEAEGTLPQYCLEGGRDYRYLRTRGKGSPTGRPGIRENPDGNAQKFAEFEENLKELDFDESQLGTIKNILSGILLLGEVEFEDGADGNAVIANPTTATSVANLLGLEDKKFSWSLLNYCVIVKGEAGRRHHSKAEAEEARDVLAKGIYFRLTDWIINTINEKLSIPRAIYGDRYYISLMDLFGFECFNKNTVEQLFVNSINEQLQFHYNQRVFVWEMQEGEEEGIPVNILQFYDNKPAVDQLMSKPDGLMYVMDEASRNGGANYLIDTLRDSSKGPYISVAGSREFSIAHYTGKVTYDAADIADKNRDFLPPEMIETMRMSTQDIVKQLFTGLLTKTGNLTMPTDPQLSSKKQGRWSAALVAEHENKRARKYNTESRGQYSQTRQMRTEAATYRGACLEVLKSLSQGGCGVHFVRCIRTDLNDKPGGFQQDVVRQQIRALAVLDTARGRQRGYSHRVPFSEFLRRYKFLAFDFDEPVELCKDNCRLLLIRLKMEGWVIGKTKVFLKYFNEEYLSRLYETQVKKIVKVQSMMRAFLAKRNLAAKIKKFQQNAGGKEIKKIDGTNGDEDTKEMTNEEAATIIQKKYRGHIVRKQYGPLMKTTTDKLDEESALFIRQWCKKWKAKSVFQVLLLYRATKHQDLVYFAQQAHLYNQNLQSELHDKIQVNLKEVDPRATVFTFLPAVRPSVHKLPFRLGDLPYFDSSYICDPMTGHRFGMIPSTDDEESWDSPLQRPVPEKYQRIRPSVLREIGSQTSVEYGYGNVTSSLSHTPFMRDPGKVVKVPALKQEESNSRYPDKGGKVGKLAPWQEGKTNSKVEHQNINMGKIKGWDERQTGYRSVAPAHEPRKFQASTPAVPKKLPAPKPPQPLQESPYRQPLSAKRPPEGNNPIKEMEEKYRRIQDSQEGDDPPFNFQAMLRKTNVTRASLKRNEDGYNNNMGNTVYSSERQNNNFNRKKSHKKFNTRKNEDGTILTELAPGLIVHGEIAEL